MANELLYMEAANMVVGDAGDGNQAGRHTAIQLQEVQLPVLEENYVEHNAGGAAFSTEVRTHFNRLVCSFNLAGWNPDIMPVLGRSDIRNQWFTLYGLIRDRETGDGLQGKARMKGRLGRVAPTAFRRGDMHAHQYAIHSIIFYELSMEQAVGQMSRIFLFDFFNSRAIVQEENGTVVDLMSDMRRALAMGG